MFPESGTRMVVWPVPHHISSNSNLNVLTFSNVTREISPWNKLHFQLRLNVSSVVYFLFNSSKKSNGILWWYRISMSNVFISDSGMNFDDVYCPIEFKQMTFYFRSRSIIYTNFQKVLGLFIKETWSFQKVESFRRYWNFKKVLNPSESLGVFRRF